MREEIKAAYEETGEKFPVAPALRINNAEKMAMLDTLPLPEYFDPNSEDQMSSIVNLNDTTLVPLHVAEFDTLFGTVCNIQRGLDYALFPCVQSEDLLLERISAKIRKRWGKRRNGIPNYWALTAYLVISKALANQDTMTDLTSGKYICDYTIKTADLFGKELLVAIGTNDNKMYLGVVRAVSEMFTEYSVDYEGNMETTEEMRSRIDTLIYVLKMDKAESIFYGTDLAVMFI